MARDIDTWGMAGIVKTFFFYKHQNKESALVNALLAAGWQQTQAKQADVIFADNDYGLLRPQLEALHRQGKTIMIYPHAGRVSLFNDLPGGEASDCVAVQFVTAPGHKEIFKRFGYPRPVEVIGWHLCPMREFQPRQEIKNVLFAPIHPDADGSLSDAYKQVNRAAFGKLAPLVLNGQINLTIRYLQKLKNNGIPEVHPLIHYIQGKPDQSYAEIDEADLVVSYGTFAAMALARGVPVVGMGEDVPPHHGGKVVRHWEEYKSIMMYPADILKYEKTMLLFNQIGIGDFARVWKRHMIGSPFDAAEFVKLVERYL